MYKNRFYNTFSIGEKMLSGFKYDLKTRNFHDDRLLLNWNYIVDEYAKRITPCKIIFSGLDTNNILQKTLYVSTNDRGFMAEFIFHKQRLLEMLNNYFGCSKSKFVDIKLKLVN